MTVLFSFYIHYCWDILINFYSQKLDQIPEMFMMTTFFKNTLWPKFCYPRCWCFWKESYLKKEIIWNSISFDIDPDLVEIVPMICRCPWWIVSICILVNVLICIGNVQSYCWMFWLEYQTEFIFIIWVCLFDQEIIVV